MSMQLGEISAFGSLWTAKPQYIIDFERGLVTHSKTLTKGQYNRYMKDPQRKGLERPDLNPRQAFSYFSRYVLGEKYLQFIRQQHQNQLYKLYFQSSHSYVANHKKQFQKIQNQLDYPVTQVPYGGYVRTPIQRDNLANYVSKIQEKAYFYGMHSWQKWEKEEAQKRTYNNLKNIAFKAREVRQATEQMSDQ